jgi:hypothetical protein
VEQVTQPAWKFAQQFAGPFSNEAAADYLRQMQNTFAAIGKVASGSLTEGQKLMAENQRRAEAILRQLAENARINTYAAFDACAAAAKARSLH